MLWLKCIGIVAVVSFIICFGMLWVINNINYGLTIRASIFMGLVIGSATYFVVKLQ